jgi:hypothetical protein
MVSSSASRAERPFSGEPLAWAAVPWKRNLTAMRARQDESPAALRLPGCQCSTASQSSNSPARAMNTFAAPPSSAGHM